MTKEKFVSPNAQVEHTPDMRETHLDKQPLHKVKVLSIKPETRKGFVSPNSFVAHTDESRVK